jgi:hypothetical protein
MRNELFRTLLEKVKYNGPPIILNRERTGLNLAEDLHLICVSYVENEIKSELIEIYTTETTKKGCNCDRLMSLCQTEFSTHKIESTKINETLKLILSELADCKKQNMVLLNRLSELELSNQSSENNKLNNLKRKRDSESASDTETCRVTGETTISTVPSTSADSAGENIPEKHAGKTSTNPKVNEKESANCKESYSKVTTKTQTKPKSSNRNKSNVRSNNIDVVRRVVDGQPRIEYSKSRKNVDSDGFTKVE